MEPILSYLGDAAGLHSLLGVVVHRPGPGLLGQGSTCEAQTTTPRRHRGVPPTNGSTQAAGRQWPVRPSGSCSPRASLKITQTQRLFSFFKNHSFDREGQDRGR